jgi:hypothetical protein
MIYAKTILYLLTFFFLYPLLASEQTHTHYTLLIKETGEWHQKNFHIYTPPYTANIDEVEKKFAKFKFRTVTLENFPLSFIFCIFTRQNTLDQPNFNTLIEQEQKINVSSNQFFENIKEKNSTSLQPYESIIKQQLNVNTFNFFLTQKDPIYFQSAKPTQSRNAGILPYTIREDGKIWFLLGEEWREEGRRWSDFGGERDKKRDGSSFATAQRECAEEAGIIFKDLKEADTIHFITDQYAIYFVRIPYIDPKNLHAIKNFRVNTKHEHNEKIAYQWFKIEKEILQPVDNTSVKYAFSSFFNTLFSHRLKEFRAQLPQNQSIIDFSLWANKIAILFYIQSTPATFFIRQDATIFTHDIPLKTVSDIKTLVKTATPLDNVITELDDFKKINFVADVIAQKAFCAIEITDQKKLDNTITWRNVGAHNLVADLTNSDDKQYAKSIATVFQPSINFLQPNYPAPPPLTSTNQSGGVATAHTDDNQPNFFAWLWNSIVSGLYRFFSFKWLLS